jgi:hypothetical protein
MAPIDDDIIYTYTHEYDETKRLSSHIGPLELARTKELLRQFLPPAPEVVLDIAAAAGPYSFWLASLGYSVHLFDIVPRHIERARSLGPTRPRPSSRSSILVTHGSCHSPMAWPMP